MNHPFHVSPKRFIAYAMTWPETQSSTICHIDGAMQ
jgi:hypothetical protein